MLAMLVVLFGAVPGCNPFAPELAGENEGRGVLISDQRTIEGVFQNMRYAYTFKDTTIYGGLLAQDFVFTYRDYDKVVDISWGRDDEMRTTHQLFQNAMTLNLVWNNIVGFSGDSLLASVTRSFNLTVTFSPGDAARVDGRVALVLRRPGSDQPWRITQWKDESNF